MAKYKFTDSEILELEDIEKQLKQPQLIKRIQSLKLRAKGFTNIEAGRFLLVSDQTISDWFITYKTKGVKELLQWNYKGKVSVLSSKEIEELKQVNILQPFETALQAKNYIKEKYNINFHLHWVQKLMKKNFSLHSKKTD